MILKKITLKKFMIYLQKLNEHYSINIIEDILEKLDRITLFEQYESITSTAEENIVDQK